MSMSSPEGEVDMMLTAYIQAAMRRATYEILPDDEGYYGEIPGLQGVYSNADTLEECRDELQSVLEGWIALGLTLGHPFPEIDGYTLMVQQDVA
jgi:predicted RNase H-like HicB family nuclease